VISDDVTGARNIVNYLIGLGHRKIAHITAGTDSSTSVDRYSGYKQAMFDLTKSERDLLIEGDSYQADAGRQAAKKILDGDFKPTAIFAGNDTLASEVLKEMRQRGLLCPNDISVVGYGNTQVARALDLTSVDQHPLTIGASAMHLLFDNREQTEAEHSTSVIECELVVRGSCGTVS
jgi:DNA-binding LacI/PurR family transcriptional regulator